MTKQEMNEKIAFDTPTTKVMGFLLQPPQRFQ